MNPFYKIPERQPLSPFLNFVESFVDNVIRDKVSSPAVGSMVYCDLLTAEHSGIYVGKGKIVHLDGDGYIEIISPEHFLERLDGLNTAISVYVSCCGTEAVGNMQAAQRARDRIGKKLEYNVIFNNCHQFTAGCMTGHFDNGVMLFSSLKSIAERELCADTWRVWDC